MVAEKLMTSAGDQNLTKQSKAHLFKKGAPSPNPSGRPKGLKDKLTVDLKRMMEAALEKAGDNVRKKRRTLKDMEAGTAYLTDIAEKRPELFMAVLKQMMPATLDINATVMNGQMIEVLTARRLQLAELRDVTPDEDIDDD
jgi:hypothetical protein